MEKDRERKFESSSGSIGALIDQERHPGIWENISTEEIHISRIEGESEPLFYLSFQRQLTPTFASLSELDEWIAKNASRLREDMMSLKKVPDRMAGHA